MIRAKTFVVKPWSLYLLMSKTAVGGTGSCGYVPLLIMCRRDAMPERIDAVEPADDDDRYCQSCSGTMYVQVCLLWLMVKPRNLFPSSGSSVTGSL